MSPLTSVILATLVNVFVVHLVVLDDVTAPIRDLLSRWRIPGKIVSCPRCFGVWAAPLSTAAVLGRLPWTDGWSSFRTFAVIASCASIAQHVTMSIHSPYVESHVESVRCNKKVTHDYTTTNGHPSETL